MEWYYATDSNEQRSTTEAELPGLVTNGQIKPSTLVWNENLPDWKPAREVRPDLFSAEPAPPVLSPAQRSVAVAPVGRHLRQH